MKRMGAIGGGLAAAGILLLVHAGDAAQRPRAPSYGFVLTRLNMAFYRGDEKIDCPEGRSHTVREAYLAMQTSAEQSRLLKPENARELEQKYKVDYVFGADGTDICTNSQLFDTPQRELQKTVQSPIGPGLDLDGAKDDAHPATGTCGHKSFKGSNGDSGIDNQYFRVLACNTFYRGASTGVGDGAGEMQWPENPAVIIISDVQSWQDDPQVRVEISASPNKPATAGGKVLDAASFAVTDNPRYRAVTTGRIINGVLLTNPVNVTLPMNWVGASGGEAVLRHARFRFKLKPDGDIEGEAGAYRPLDNAVATGHVGGPGVASVAGLECASVRKTMRLLADGDRDPKTGQCSSISEGFEFAARPAYVFDRGTLIAAPGGSGG